MQGSGGPSIYISSTCVSGFFVFGRMEDLLKHATATTTISRLHKAFKIGPVNETKVRLKVSQLIKLPRDITKVNISKVVESL